MSEIFEKLNQFIGQRFNHVSDTIDGIAADYGLVAVPGFPDGIGNIDVEDNRLNVFVDNDDCITHFTIG